MKQTWQKQVVLETVQKMTNHPTADEVYREIIDGGQDVGIATVYRNLNSFAKKGLIRKVTVPDNADRFDYRLDSHEHFLCESCGRVYDASVTVNIAPADDDREYRSYSLILYGVCDHCAQKNKKYPAR